MIPGYYVRHMCVLYDSDRGGWYRYSDWMETRKEAEAKYQRVIRGRATTIQLIHVLHNDISGETKIEVVKEYRADIGAKTFKA